MVKKNLLAGAIVGAVLIGGLPLIDTGNLSSPILLAELCALLAVAYGIIALLGLEPGRRQENRAVPVRAASWSDAPPRARGLNL